MEPMKYPKEFVSTFDTPRYVTAKNIAEAPIGAFGYTLPWAITVMENDDTWINGAFPFSATPHGTHELRIKRVRNGVMVDFTHARKDQRRHKEPWGNPALPVVGRLLEDDGRGNYGDE